MTLDELYREKGRLTMERDIAQAKLSQVDSEIIQILNEKNKAKEIIPEK